MKCGTGLMSVPHFLRGKIDDNSIRNEKYHQGVPWS